MYGMLCHLLGFTGMLGIPFGGVLGPLVIWLMKKDESAFVNQAGKDAMNFQISIMIYIMICVPFIFLFLIGYVGMLVLFILWVINVIQASIAANQGLVHVYPFSITFIR